MTKPIGWTSRVVVLLVLSALASMLLPANLAGDQEGTVIESTEYYTVELVFVDGVPTHKVIINGPPEPPAGFVRETVALPEPQVAMGINTLSNVPAFDWSFGCSATSAAMIAGYYDRTGYPNMYAGPTNGGVMPLVNSGWSNWTDSCFVSGDRCPLSATQNGLDGRATKGHVDDYWICYNNAGPDPFVGTWTEHTYGDCTGDYMKTSQSVYGNVDGATTFWYYTNGAPLTAAGLEAAGPSYSTTDGGYGNKLFYESRGYTVTNMYNQYRLGFDPDGAGPLPVTAQGCTFADYKAEIDAGRPVMIHVTGHTMVGVGYDDSTNLMYIHDTWDHSVHTMTWGGTYGTAPVMYHLGMTIVQLAAPLGTAAVFRVTQEGHVLADGTFRAFDFLSGGADVAEWVNVSEPVEPGDVLELDPDNPGQYRKARGPCSSLIAGVVSSDPGVILGSGVVDSPVSSSALNLARRTSHSALMALIGIVPVKACGEGGPILPGDLLVTASRSGYVKRSEPGECTFIVGKALEPLVGREGFILALLTR